ncbi:hypothetical protein [Limnoglobus roseus]|uniref:Uncharacterized protein n=1 Tax=Limnoglobus roseus TaxID=2598579 RepID=A0A5C1AK58_9BACT|nr:hypothetical protein [Limnoglobus roseus]QEL19260.1 hypothetical protein PX52LOC_06322 [Limnoglobus roseus]
MTAEELQPLVDKGFTNDQFAEVVARLRSRPAAEVFGLLWPVALNGDLTASHWAGCLLIQLEPWCPLSVEDAVREVAASALNLSYREVPFYLAAQFGKRAVGEAVRVVAAEFAGKNTSGLGATAYWLGMPAVELVGWFWRWRSRWGTPADDEPPLAPCPTE